MSAAISRAARAARLALVTTPGRRRSIGCVLLLSGGADRSTTSSENCSTGAGDGRETDRGATARRRGVSGVLLTASGARGADGSLISGSSSSSCVGVNSGSADSVAAAEPDDMTTGDGAIGWNGRFAVSANSASVVERLVDVIARTPCSRNSLLPSGSSRLSSHRSWRPMSSMTWTGTSSTAAG